MTQVAVNSSNIRSVGYDPETQTLEITFNNGAVYEYSGVSPETYAGLVGADSPGKYFFGHIRNQYPTTRKEATE